MATPVGHGLLGITIGRWVGAPGGRARFGWYLYLVFAATAADLDFLPGLWVGDMNRYHHLATHSVAAAVVFGAVSVLLARLFSAHPWRIGVVGAAAYASHLLVDFFTVDRVAPFGLPLWWPFSDTFYLSPVQIIPAVEHGAIGQPTATVLGQIFSAHNLYTIAVELALFLPLWGIVWFASRRTLRGIDDDATL